MFNDLVQNEMVNLLHQMYTDMKATNRLSLEELARANPQLHSQIRDKAEESARSIMASRANKQELLQPQPQLQQQFPAAMSSDHPDWRRDQDQRYGSAPYQQPGQYQHPFPDSGPSRGLERGSHYQAQPYLDQQQQHRLHHQQHPSSHYQGRYDGSVGRGNLDSSGRLHSDRLYQQQHGPPAGAADMYGDHSRRPSSRYYQQGSPQPQQMPVQRPGTGPIDATLGARQATTTGAAGAVGVAGDLGRAAVGGGGGGDSGLAGGVRPRADISSLHIEKKRRSEFEEASTTDEDDDDSRSLVRGRRSRSSRGEGGDEGEGDIPTFPELFVNAFICETPLGVDVERLRRLRDDLACHYHGQAEQMPPGFHAGVDALIKRVDAYLPEVMIPPQLPQILFGAFHI